MTEPQVFTDPAELRAALQGRGTVGFVPTMGYLHDGHATLMRWARQSCDTVVLSIYVNPLQFGPNEDYASYPRDLERDLKVARSAGVDFVFAPSDANMYPPGFSTRVSVNGVSDTLDGLSRPGHFTGVATVVLKLLNLVRPDKVFLGEKDWQQVAVLRRMITDLNVAVEVVGVPTVRSEEAASLGLALSSRNSYLNEEQKARATVLSRALRAVQAAYAAGERDTQALKQAGLNVLKTEPDAQLDYLTVVDSNLQETPRIAEDPFNRILIAARMFGVRLIDNMPLSANNGAHS
ncbi:pantoate--beta-alanine ligase [Deinococcus fonticola]|uniref:pantoate--beta-alanine ligase n=1 Tax=Deinococcus fonticola TaxID=2528713 RepID=UPI0010757739|nr:pantoate--beta-alanine ligase [Deinococcus fonticola]